MTGCVYACWLLVVCLDPGIRIKFPGLNFFLSKRPKNKINLHTHRSGIRLPSKQTVGESRKLWTKKQYVQCGTCEYKCELETLQNALVFSLSLFQFDLLLTQNKFLDGSVLS
jgi:hypothetical protein